MSAGLIMVTAGGSAGSGGASLDLFQPLLWSAVATAVAPRPTAPPAPASQAANKLPPAPAPLIRRSLLGNDTFSATL